MLRQALNDVGAIVATMINDLGSCVPGRPGSDPRNVYKVGLNTTRLLMALGDVICAWLLLRGAEVALDRLNEELSAVREVLLRRQGRLRSLVCAYRAAKADRRACHR